MNVLSVIINELSDDTRSLTGPLLKTLVLATRIKNDEIAGWANDEIGGYRGKKEIPAYRIARPVLRWTVAQGGEVQPEEPVSLMMFDEESQERISRVRVDDSVEVLEAQTKRHDGQAVRAKNHPPDYCQFLTRKIKHNRVPPITILAFRSDTDISEVIQTLASIRLKLLRFMLQLESDVPELARPQEQIQPLNEPEQKLVTQIFHSYFINVSGNKNTVIAGDANQANRSI